MDGNVVLVAVDASKEITDYALEWTVRNIIKSMDSLVLFAVLPSSRSHPPAAAVENETQHSRTHQFLSCLWKKWGGLGPCEENTGLIDEAQQDVSQRINNVCVLMMQQLCSAHKIKKVHTEVMVVADAQLGSVATKAREVQATWVVLDRRLKKEGDCCLKHLNCNIVLIDHAIPKILRAVNPLAERKFSFSEDHRDPTVADMLGVLPSSTYGTTTQSSLGIESSRLDTDASVSLSSAEKKQYNRRSISTTKFKSSNPIFHLNSEYFEQVEVQDKLGLSPSYDKSRPMSKIDSLDIGDSPHKSSASSEDGRLQSYSGHLRTKRGNKQTRTASIPARRSTDSLSLLEKHVNPNHSDQLITRRDSTAGYRSESVASPSSSTVNRTSSIKMAMSLSIKHPPTPPPLRSLCRHNVPIFGAAPRKFRYREIELATNGFSRDNFLAEGGYGPVYKGVLPDGQVVAVKQHKTLSAQGASEFCSEVEVLSCAQHRNLVMLVGYCIEREWLLIYEFACNGSLDKHLYGSNEVMGWHKRMKVAIGAARGLRYLHEDCRMGCIVHRDFRPSNILLTHDFEPMVGDFGLARCQAYGQSAEETRAVGAFGYLAPEYTQTGLITEKTDVYAFGVVLLELLCGIKATDFSRNTGQQFALEWGLPLLENKMINEIIDPRLEKIFVEKEVECMMYAASLCISPHPEQRPRISKVLKILEGDIPNNMAYNCAEQYMNNIYREESAVTLDYTPTLMQSLQQKNLSPSGKCLRTNKELNGTFKKTLTVSQEKVVSNGWGLNKSDLSVSDEYEAYLQGSLAKFIQNLNGK